MAGSNVVVEMTSDEARLLRGMQKIIDQQSKVEKGFGKVKDKSKAAGKQNNDSFGANAVNQLKSYALGFASVTAGIGLATSALRSYNEERNRGAEILKAESGGMSQLAQLAGGDTGKLKQLISEVRKTQKETGASGDEAASLQFALESLGVSGDREFFAGFRKIADPKALAEGAATLQAAFGEDETGNVREVTNKLLAASAVSKTTVQEFAPAATIAAQESKQIGGGDEELLGTMAILSRATKNADMASTQIASLATTIAKEGLGGQGLLAGIDAVEKSLQGMTGAEKLGLFGMDMEEMSESESFMFFKKKMESMSDKDKFDFYGRDNLFGMKESEKFDFFKEKFGSMGSEEKGEFFGNTLQKMNDEEMFEFFGRREAFKGYQAIQQNRQLIEETIRQVQAEQFGSMSENIKNSILGVDELRGVRNLEIKEQENSIEVAKKYGTGQLSRQEALKDISTRSLSNDESFITRWGRVGMANVQSAVGWSGESINDSDKMLGSDTGSSFALIGETMEDLLGAAQALATSAVSLREATSVFGRNRTLSRPDDDPGGR